MLFPRKLKCLQFLLSHLVNKGFNQRQGETDNKGSRAKIWGKRTVICISSVVHSCSTLLCHGLQPARLPCPSATPWAYSNSCPSHWWGHATISSSVIPFSSRLQSFPASGSFPKSWFFASGDQSIGVSASVSVLPVNTQDWFPLGWTSWISLQSKGLSSLLQHHSSKRSFLWCSVFFTVPNSDITFMTTGKNHSFD